MDEAYMGTIIMWAPNYAPRGWAFCSGQILPIQQNAALFSLLGTTYGGNGSTTFALPNLIGRFPLCASDNHRLGEMSGTDSVTLTYANLPSHTHPATITPIHLNVSTENGTLQTPTAGASLGTGVTNSGREALPIYNYTNEKPDVTLSESSIGVPTVTIGNSGANQSFCNMPPYLTINFIICVMGIFPPRP